MFSSIVEITDEAGTRTEKIWMNGELVDWDDATVHILNPTLHYGWGVFEGIRAYETAERIRFAGKQFRRDIGNA